MFRLSVSAAICLILAQPALAHTPDVDPNSLTAVFADLKILKAAGLPVLYADPATEVGYAVLSGAMEQKLSQVAHQHGRCGNYEALDKIPADLAIVRKSIENLNRIQNKDRSYSSLAKNFIPPVISPVISEALLALKAENIKGTVAWLSAFPTRYDRGTNPNAHVVEFTEKLKSLVTGAKYPVTVELIPHQKTKQKSIRVTIRGSERPAELVIFGGHLDSTNGWGSASKPAPGADDNASGSASLLEALRVLLTQEQPKRTIEFYWYAGEESGLLGSAEIAESYKTLKKNVISVLQLDMTMFPGDGEFKITSITDFTSPWLRDYMKALSAQYLNIEIFDDKCGYGCSDHASWYRRGFPTVFPTEAKFNSSFQDIHTERDVISPVMSFEHSLVFSKIALAMALDLGNSTQKESDF